MYKNNHLLTHFQLNLEDRFVDGLNVDGAFLSIDGTDCMVNEPMPFNKMWFSHKFRGPGLRYEVGVSNGSGRLVWANGPFPAGSFPDRKIFQLTLLNILFENETVIGDNGYVHPRCITPDVVSEENTEIFKILRARHENVNERLKNFNVIRHIFRHHLSMHGYVFHAVAQLTALMMNTTDPLFSVT